MQNSNRFTSPASIHRKFFDVGFKFLCFASAMLAILFLVYLLGSVAKDGFGRLDLNLLQGFSSRNPAKAGIQAGIYGTLFVILLTTVMAVPVGIAAAVYLEEFAPKNNRWVSFIQLNIANLAAVPSIVYGLLGLSVFVTMFGFGRSIIAASCTMALLILPLIIVVAQEAIRAVPSTYRESSLALGATPIQTVRRQILPIALPAIITGIILSVSRAIGETAPLIVVGAVTVTYHPPRDLSDKFTVLPIQIFYWISEPKREFHELAAGAIIVLIGTLLLLNSVAIVIRARSQKLA